MLKLIGLMSLCSITMTCKDTELTIAFDQISGRAAIAHEGDFHITCDVEELLGILEARQGTIAGFANATILVREDENEEDCWLSTSPRNWTVVSRLNYRSFLLTAEDHERLLNFLRRCGDMEVQKRQTSEVDFWLN